MKTTAKLLLAGLLAAVATPAQAAPLKIGIVDMQKVYMQFYKTRVNENELEKHKLAAREELAKRMKKFNGLKEELKSKITALRGTTDGSAARKKAEEDYRAKEQEAQSLARDIDEFGKRRQKMIGDMLKRMQDEIIQELQGHVTKSSTTYDLVFDKTGISTTGVSVMIFSKDAIDFTDDVIKAVNVDAPADVPAAPAAPPSVTAPAEPGAGAAPADSIAAPEAGAAPAEAPAAK